MYNFIQLDIDGNLLERGNITNHIAKDLKIELCISKFLENA